MPKEIFHMNKFIKSFGYAAKGLWQLIRCEQNARVHLLATIVVIVAGWITGLDRYEWMAIGIAIGMVWAAEAFNTAIEKLVDFVSPEKHPKAGLVKDIAAAGVLICAIAALAIAGLVFIPHFI